MCICVSELYFSNALQTRNLYNKEFQITVEKWHREFIKKEPVDIAHATRRVIHYVINQTIYVNLPIQAILKWLQQA